MTTNEHGTIHTLGDRGLTVDGSLNDVRGREVVAADGHTIGTVAELLVDDERTEVRFLLVDHGGVLGFGATHTLVPVEAVTAVSDDAVTVHPSRERIASAPVYAPGLVDDHPFRARTYDHYGYVPTWGEGYLYPYYGRSR